MMDALIITSVLQNQPSPQGKLPRGISLTHTPGYAEVGEGKGTKQDSSSSWDLPASLFQAPKHGCASLSGLVGRKEFGVGMEAEYSLRLRKLSRAAGCRRRVLKKMNPKSLASTPLIFPPCSKC